MHLQGQSLCNYITAVSLIFALLTCIHPQYCNLATLSQWHIYLYLYLQDRRVTQHTKGSTLRPLKEPFKYPMFAMHAKILTPKTCDLVTFFSLNHMVWDWLHLGIFHWLLGCRVCPISTMLQPMLPVHPNDQGCRTLGWPSDASFCLG
jgi:hypothetical protein